MNIKELLLLVNLLAFFFWSVAGFAETPDLLVQLPVKWQSELEPVPDSARGSGLDLSAHKKISSVRSQLIQTLQKKTLSRQELAGAYARLGAYYLHYAIYTLAELSYANAAKLDPDDFRWAYYLAFTAHQSGLPEMALQRYARARQLDDHYPPLDIRVADIHLDLNQLNAAAENYRRAVAIQEFAAPAEYGLGQIALLQRQYNQAITHFEKVLHLDPKATQTHYPLAQAYRALKQNDKARQSLALYAKGKPEIDDPLIRLIKNLEQVAALHFNNAVTAVNQGKFALAQKEFAAGLELDAENAAAHVSYARALLLAGQDEIRVSQELQQAITLDNDNTLALFLLGILADAKNNQPLAVNYYQQVLHIDPDHSGAHFYLAEHLFNKADFSTACPHYKQTIALEPMNLTAQLKNLICLEKQGQPDPLLYAQLDMLQKRFTDLLLFRFYQVHLLALSNIAEFRDAPKALAMAQKLVEMQPIAPHFAALALAFAANGEFNKAVRLQDSLINTEYSSISNDIGKTEKDQAKHTLSLYQSGQLPEREDWFSVEPGAMNKPIDPHGPFRYYPAPRPY